MDVPNPLTTIEAGDPPPPPHQDLVPNPRSFPPGPPLSPRTLPQEALLVGTPRGQSYWPVSLGVAPQILAPSIHPTHPPPPLSLDPRPPRAMHDPGKRCCGHQLLTACGCANPVCCLLCGAAGHTMERFLLVRRSLLQVTTADLIDALSYFRALILRTGQSQISIFQ